ncbi:hypothetical protein [Krasilnikoviella flava]|uniref:Uncharacterized protein n=1 Tax=Krasilnikoviella flava TaxID=526729 RepID=A0A1T5JL20_9MICO|nr:hypothetical protein [Krasilnikoviella flava]SKC51823.1 hypothetical protein SAMN04324258_1477 [Krasilnikoviella flava]
MQPRIQAAVAEGAFLAVQEAKGAGESDTMQAAILAAYARAWDNLRVVIERRVEDDVI